MNGIPNPKISSKPHLKIGLVVSDVVPGTCPTL